MRPARQREEHRAALDRRLEQLQAELAGVRPVSAEAGAARGEGGDAARGEPVGDGTPPAPGRHLAPGAAQWTLAPVHLRVIAVLVVVSLVASGWWLLRSRPEAAPREVGLSVAPADPEASAADVSDAAGGAGPTDTGPEPAGPDAETRPGGTSRGAGQAGGAAAPAADEVVVHVAGRVRRPGIVRLPGGSRVVDAVEAAGGSRPGVRLRDLNLARALVDGEQVLVGLPGAAAPAPAPPAATSSGTPEEPSALVDLNTADQPLLETLPGVGPVTAGKILAWRDENGRFTAVEELLEVDGIGDVTLADLAPLVTV